MAFEGFAGFNFKRSSQVFDEFQQGIRAAQASGNLDAMRMATAQQAAFAVSGGSAEYRAAKKRERVLRGAYESVDRTGDEIEDQMAYYKAAQEAAAEAGLPDITMQATEKLSALRMTQEERERLQAAEARAQAAERRAKAEEYRERERHKWDRTAFGQEYATKGRWVITDSEGEYLDTVDLTDESGAGINRVRELREQYDGKILHVTEDDWFGALQDLKLEQLEVDDEGSELPPTTLNRYNQAVQGHNTFNAAMDQLVDIIDSGPEGLSIQGKGRAALNRLGSQGRQFVASNGQTDAEQQAIISRAERKYNLADSRLRGAVINLAYALASSREGGKLSESDVKLAAQTLGVEGQPDPAAALYVLRDAVERNKNAWQNVPDLIVDFKQHEGAYTSWQNMDNQYANLWDKMNDRISKWDAGKNEIPSVTRTAPGKNFVVGEPEDEEGNKVITIPKRQ